jgi:hypothetical protein
MKQSIAAAALCLFATAANALVITPNKQCDANSYVHEPLSPTHPLDPNSAAIVAGLNAHSPIKYINTSDYASPIFVVGDINPEQPHYQRPLLGSSPPRRN